MYNTIDRLEDLKESVSRVEEHFNNLLEYTTLYVSNEKLANEASKGVIISVVSLINLISRISDVEEEIVESVSLTADFCTACSSLIMIYNGHGTPLHRCYNEVREIVEQYKSAGKK